MDFTHARTDVDGFALWRYARTLPLLEVLVAFSLFPAVYVGADRLAPLQQAAPVSFYYLTIGAGTLVALGVFLFDRRLYPLSLFVFVATLAFVGWAALSLRWTAETGGYHRYKLHRMIVFDTVLLGFGLVLAQSRRRIVAFALVMGVIGAWLSAEAVYASYVLDEFAFATVGSETYLTHGRAIGFAVPLLAYVLFSHEWLSVRLLAGGLVVAGILGSLTAGGRGPFIALIVALGVFVALETMAALASRRIDARRLVAASGVTVVVAGAVFLAVRSLGRTPWTLERLRTIGGASETETRRFMLVEAAELWLERPIRGHGIGSYAALTETVHQYPHNVVVETLAELGLVGFGLAALIVLPPLFASLAARFRGGNAMYSALVALFVFMFLNACFSFDLHSNRQLFFAVGLMAYGWTGANSGVLSRPIELERAR